MVIPFRQSTESQLRFDGFDPIPFAAVESERGQATFIEEYTSARTIDRLEVLRTEAQAQAVGWLAVVDAILDRENRILRGEA